MRLIEERATTVVLLAINLLLLALAALALHTPPREEDASARAVHDGEGRIELPAARPLLAQFDDYQAIIDRPLFWSERRALADFSAATADAAQSSVPFVLLGVVTGRTSKALLGKPGAKEVTRASEGDVVEGWLVEEVGRQSVTLASGSVRRQLQVGPGVAAGN